MFRSECAWDRISRCPLKSGQIELAGNLHGWMKFSPYAYAAGRCSLVSPLRVVLAAGPSGADIVSICLVDSFAVPDCRAYDWTLIQIRRGDSTLPVPRG